jgi:dimethylamine corrinoid protein
LVDGKNILEWTKELCANLAFNFDKYPDPESNSVLSYSELIALVDCLKSCAQVIWSNLGPKGEKLVVQGRVIIGNIEGGTHYLGKDLVNDIYSLAGYQVIDLGIFVTADTFISHVKLLKPDVLAISCSISCSKLVIRDIVKRLKVLGLRDKITVITGGFALCEEYVEFMGVHANGANVAIALEKTAELMRIRKEQNTPF